MESYIELCLHLVIGLLFMPGMNFAPTSGHWTAWSPCKHAYGHGLKFRTWKCGAEKRSKCVESLYDVKICSNTTDYTNAFVVSVEDSWSPWTKCSSMCGNGISFRIKPCRGRRRETCYKDVLDLRTCVGQNDMCTIQLRQKIEEILTIESQRQQVINASKRRVLEFIGLFVMGALCILTFTVVLILAKRNTERLSDRLKGRM